MVIGSKFYATYYNNKFTKFNLAVIQVTAFAGYKAPEQFCVGRVVTGVGNGINTATIPTWQVR